MLSIRDLLVCCDNLGAGDMLKIVGKNHKVIIETVGECLLTEEIKKMTVDYFYIADDIESVISVKEDL